MENEKTRKRGRNFTEREKQIARNIINRYRHIVENKATDGASLSIRKAAWENIAKEYNACAVSEPRTSKDLKILCFNLRRIAKKSVTSENRTKYLNRDLGQDLAIMINQQNLEDQQNMSKTGGEPYESPVDTRLLPMIIPQTKPLPKVCDDSIHSEVVVIKEEANHIEQHDRSSFVCSSPYGSMVTPELSPRQLLPIAGPSSPIPDSESINSSFQVPGGNHLPPTQQIKKNRTAVNLKRTLYLKRIKLANMEINFRRKMYALELKIKQKVLAKLNKGPNNNV